MTVFEYMMEVRELREKESDNAFKHWLEVIEREHTETELSEAKAEYVKRSERYLEVVSLMAGLVEKGLI